MTELGITQEYLLLTVNDRGRFSPLNAQQPVCFVAAALGELAEAGCVAFLGEKVGLGGPLPEELRCLKPLYDFIDRPRPVPLAMALRDFSPDGPKLAELAETVGESLEALGLAAPQRALAGRVFYLPAAGQAPRRLERLLFHLSAESGPAPKEAALAVLLCQSGAVAQKAGAAAAAKAEAALAALLPTGSNAARAAHAAQDMADRVNAVLR
ncbi:GPP34 family phosphoprotein [Candidatus Allofournierella merdipullorum]|uniref:GPP34 family phosphoprotein n=1 Tax=Candidatus Allofournierella merdipullorum TaxID=2838595 RepID=UPI00374F7F3D